MPPSSPTRLSRPEIERAQSAFFTPSSFSSRWVSSLLSTAAGPPLPRHRSTTSAAGVSDDDAAQPPTHTRAQTTSSLPIDSAITHGSPFAPHPFTPADGAPGFAGDRQWDKGFEFDNTSADKKGVRLIGRKEMTTAVLSVELADMLRAHLPALARLPRVWTLLYSLDQHGISLNTLYTRCQGHTGSALVVMRDDGDAVFGAWMGEGIHPSKGSYYGSGESFLWRLMGDMRLRVYKWTGRNDYVALCEAEYISFGGGDGNYGLYLDDTLTDGSSARCPTFDNEPLCSAGPRKGQNTTFECVGLEVWGVG
ncbi:TLD-domain-containing protein [Amylocystis lapponica]|nr:TLD-domain-containing protein [Amylocystis lapponica]